MIHHPAFQSLVLPFLLGLVGMALLRALAGPRAAPWGGLLGLLGALAWLPGFDWPALSRAQKLPWIACAGVAALALAAWAARHAGGRAPANRGGVLACLIWAAAAFWLAGDAVSAMALGGAIALGGTLLLGLGLGSREVTAQPDGRTASGFAASPTPSAWPVASQVGFALSALGLAGLGATGGSLLVAQLALMVASAFAAVATIAAAAARMAWKRPPEAEVPTALGQAFALAWLGIAWTWVLAAPVPTGTSASGLGLDAERSLRVLALMLAAVLPSMLDRVLSRRRTGVRAWPAMLLAAMVTVGALALPAPGADPGGAAGPFPGGGSRPAAGAEADDPYLTPPGR